MAQLVMLALVVIAVVFASIATASTLNWRVLGSSSSQGDYATTVAGGSADHPRQMAVRVYASPNQHVSGSWSMTCGKGLGAGSKSGDFNGVTPLVHLMTYPMPSPDSCDASASAQLDKSGSITVQILEGTVPTSPPPPSGGSGRCHVSHTCPSQNHSYVWHDAAGEAWNCGKESLNIDYSHQQGQTTILYSGFGEVTTYQCSLTSLGQPPGKDLKLRNGPWTRIVSINKARQMVSAVDRQQLPKDGLDVVYLPGYLPERIHTDGVEALARR